jgi:hypothetical protein
MTTTTTTTNAYMNYAFWALGLICAVGIGVAILVTR